VLPLGAGALAGIDFGTDRQMLAVEVAPNSIDAAAP
jgi:argininosuccinate lyase